MTKKSVRKVSKGAHLPAVLVLAAITIATLATANAFIGEGDSPTTAHANTSANPYQPVKAYSKSSRSTQMYSTSAVPTLPKNTLIRKIKTAERSAKTIQRQLMRVEDQIDAVTAAMLATSAKEGSKLLDTLDRLTDRQAKLEQRLAELNTRIADWQLQLNSY